MKLIHWFGPAFFLLCLIIGSGVSSYAASPVIDHNDFLAYESGTTAKVYAVTDPSTAAPIIDAIGENQTFDFTNLHAESFEEFTLEAAPFGPNVPHSEHTSQATHANVYRFELTSGIEEQYAFYEASSSEYSFLGSIGITISHETVPPTQEQVEWPNRLLQHPLPLEFRSQWRSSVFGVDRSMEVDSWGTLVTPEGSAPCLRIKHTWIGEEHLTFVSKGTMFEANIRIDSSTGGISSASYTILTAPTSLSPGSLINGQTYQGTIAEPHEEDRWTFEGIAGQQAHIRLGETDDGSGFNSWIALLDPNGQQIETDQGPTEGWISQRLEATGQHTIIIRDFDTNGRSSGESDDDTGSYRLELNLIPSPFTISPNDQGGKLSNGGRHSGTISVGDLDRWTFDGKQGQRLHLRLGETDDGSGFHPWIALISPSGDTLETDQAPADGWIALTLDQTGEYSVLVSDTDTNGNSTGEHNDDTGSYRLELSLTPSPFEVSEGDEGGPLQNGIRHNGSIDIGDIDQWTFTGQLGDRVHVRLAETDDGSGLNPWLALISPSGEQLRTDSAPQEAWIAHTLEEEGTYTVLVTDADTNGNSAGEQNDDTGSYRIELAHVPGDLSISEGDDGGELQISTPYYGTIEVGDIDHWSFFLPANSPASIQLSNTDLNASLHPHIELIDPTGKELLSDSDAEQIDLDFTTTQAGFYHLIVGDADTNGNSSGEHNDDAGTYSLIIHSTTPVFDGESSFNVRELSRFVEHVNTNWTANPRGEILYELVKAPEGLTLTHAPVNVARLDWIPTEVQGPGDYEVTLRATNEVDGHTFSSETTLSVHVQEHNRDSQITVQETAQVDEGSSVRIPYSVFDPDIPTNDLLVEIIDGPDGLELDTANSQVIFTPKESHGPGDHQFSLMVTDFNPIAINGGERSTIARGTISVAEINQAPQLALINNVEVNVDEPLSILTEATDNDLPANTLTYTLESAPPGMLIHSETGAISWTPEEALAGQDFIVNVLVTDDGTPSLSDRQSFTVSVERPVLPISLSVPSDLRIAELEEFTTIIKIENDPAPDSEWSYELVNGPEGATLDPTTGEFRWMPSEEQGPGQFSTGIIATSSSRLRTPLRRPFNITVSESNLPPTLRGLNPSYQTEIGTPFQITPSATDPDLPANLLSYAIVDAPSGMTIHSESGQIDWTPNEDSANQDFTVNVVVSDNGEPSLSERQSFTVNVNVSEPKVSLVLPTDQEIEEHVKFSTNIKLENFAPGTDWSFDITNAPDGATLNPISGEFDWTPSEEQGPGQFPIEIFVTGPTRLNGTFTLTVIEANQAPTLSGLKPRYDVDAETLLVIHPEVIDSDFPKNELEFAIEGSPSELSIDPATGQIEWIPNSELAGQTFSVTVTVSDDGSPALSDAETILLGVNPLQSPATLIVPEDAVINEAEIYESAAMIESANAQDAQWEFSLIEGPEGLIIDATTGAISWTPTETQGPGQFNIRVQANGPSRLAEQFTLTVNESNQSPQLESIPNQTIRVGEKLTIAAQGSDEDFPVNELRYELLEHPTGMTIEAGSGKLEWTPTASQADQSHTVSITLSDDGVPPLTIERSWEVAVLPQISDVPILAPTDPISGIVSGRMGPSGAIYLITDDVTVPTGKTLFIDAGVTIQFQDGDDNLIVNGTLLAIGTQDAPITFTSDNSTKRPGNWQSIRFRNSHGSSLAHCFIEYGGWFSASGRPMVDIVDSNVRFNHCTIRQSDRQELHITRSDIHVAQTTFESNHGYPMSIDTHSFPSLEQLTADGSIEIRGGQATESGTWENGGIPFTITDDLTIESGAIIDIEKGTTIQFQDGDDNLIVNGTLQAIGTQDAPITFTSDNSTKRPGNWQSIRFRNSHDSSLAHCFIEYGGWFSASGRPMVDIVDSNVRFNHCTIRQSDRQGLQITRSDIHVAQTTFESNHGYPMSIDTHSFPSLERLTADGSIEIRGGQVTESGTWENGDIPFTITDDVTISPDTLLHIEAGTTIQFQDGDDNLRINGNLQALGTAEQPITFTSDNSTKRHGNWQSIRFNDSIGSRLVFCTIEYGGWFGASGRPMIDLSNSEVDFTNCLIRFSDQHGIQFSNSKGSLAGSQIKDNHNDGIHTLENAKPSITSSTIKGNGGFGINNQDESIIVIATNNYWGDPSGPFDNENLDTLNLLNPIRTGDSVTEFVDWSNPLTTEPSPIETQTPTTPDLPPIPGQEPANLNLAILPSGEIELSWPTNVEGLVIESSVGLVSPIDWTALSEIPEIRDGLFHLNIPANENMAFFRLNSITD